MKFRGVRSTGSQSRKCGLAAGILTVTLYAAMVLGAAGDTTADRVLGQSGFTTSAVSSTLKG